MQEVLDLDGGNQLDHFFTELTEIIKTGKYKDFLTFVREAQENGIKEARALLEKDNKDVIKILVRECLAIKKSSNQIAMLQFISEWKDSGYLTREIIDALKNYKFGSIDLVLGEYLDEE